MKFDSEKMNESAKDEIAKTVVERFERAAEYKDSHIVHQRKTFQYLSDRADHQYRRTYMPEDIKILESSFGFVPTRYYGLTQIKTNATKAWKRDLIVANLDSIFTVFPSPNPTIDENSKRRIRIGVQQELLAKMAEFGVQDANILHSPDGKLEDYRMEDYLINQVQTLKKIEQTRIMATAMDAGNRAKTQLQDILVEGNFRQSYGRFTHDQVLYGIGFMKFPDYQTVPVLQHSGKKVERVFKVRPMFRHVSVHNMYPTADGPDLQKSTAVIELAEIKKIELINLHNQKGYDKGQIEKILEDFEEVDRNWLGIEEYSRNEGFWDLDESIPMLIHEGFFTGSELADYGISGVNSTEYVNAKVVVVGGRTIKCELSKAPKKSERSYFAVPFNRFGDDLWDVLGMGSMLWDTEQRINATMHAWENNLEWSSRPPIIKNPGAFENPEDSNNIIPGHQYDVDNDMAASGRIPDPIRPMVSVSAQYNLIYSQVAQLLRAADDECGVPSFAYGAQDFGRASLGEYAQRMSNALRTIKDAALEEDIWFIEPAFEMMFSILMQEEEGLAEGQDVDLQVRGMTGLLHEDLETENQRENLAMLIGMDKGTGIVPPEVIKYGVRQFLESAGYPVEALGLDDPTINMALAKAAADAATAPATQQGVVNSQQVPKVDGRSGPIAQGAVASPKGMSEY